MLKFNKITVKKLGLLERLEILTIKLRVKVTLIFFQNSEIVKDSLNNNIINELTKWVQKNTIKFYIIEKEKNIYVTGHHLLYEFNETRNYKILKFSK